MKHPLHLILMISLLQTGWARSASGQRITEAVALTPVSTLSITPAGGTLRGSRQIEDSRQPMVQSEVSPQKTSARPWMPWVFGGAMIGSLAGAVYGAQVGLQAEMGMEILAVPISMALFYGEGAIIGAATGFVAWGVKEMLGFSNDPVIVEQ